MADNKHTTTTDIIHSGAIPAPRGTEDLIKVKQYLVALGAPRDEVYVTDSRHQQPIGRRKQHPEMRRKQSLYDHYTKSDLLFWGRNLYRSSVVKYHPDKQEPGSEAWFAAHDKFREIVEIWNKLHKTLTFKLSFSKLKLSGPTPYEKRRGRLVSAAPKTMRKPVLEKVLALGDRLGSMTVDEISLAINCNPRYVYMLASRHGLRIKMKRG